MMGETMETMETMGTARASKSVKTVHQYQIAIFSRQGWRDGLHRLHRLQSEGLRTLPRVDKGAIHQQPMPPAGNLVTVDFDFANG